MTAQLPTTTTSQGGSRRRGLVLTMLTVCAMAVAVATPSTAAADACDEGAEEKKGEKNFHIEYRNGQKITVINTVVTVCGKVPRPSVVYVLQPKSINYEWESLKQDFLPLILETIKKAPF